MSDKHPINPTPPVEDEKIKLTPPKKVAAGIPALKSSLKHARSEMGASNCLQSLFAVNQFDGFDCPGCAWPDPDDHRSSLGEYCENGVKAVAEEATKKRVGPDFFAKYSVSELSTWSDFQLGKSGRLTHPMMLRAGAQHYEPIDWDQAFGHIAEKLKNIDPDEAIFYTSGRTSNEAAFLYQLFVRQYGTNNLPDCSNMCHESSGVGLSETLGIGKGSVRLEDFYVADLIIVMGQNPGTNHPRMLSALERAKKGGAKIITINPLFETGLQAFRHPQKVAGIFGKPTTLTDLFLPVMINEDVALLKTIMCILLEKESQGQHVLDRPFIENRTEGFESLENHLKGLSIDALIAKAKISKEKVYQAADWIASKKKIIICWAMGLTQHENGVDNIREVVNLLLMKGAIGKPGAGTCPVRGHSNVQGDRTMGIWEKPKPAFLDKLAEVFKFNPPRNHGHSTISAIEAMAKGQGKVFFAMGGNFISASPDTEYTALAMQRCELTVQVSTKLNRSHLITGREAIILPCLGRTEEDVQNGQPQFVSVENSMGIVHKSIGNLEPASKKLRSEPAIVASLAQAVLGTATSLDWGELITNYDGIRDLIERVIPGFDQYNKRVRQSGGFYLPNCTRDGDFDTDSSKAKFTINEVASNHLKENEFIMMTIRSHDQFNTTIYGLDDRYRGIFNGRRVVLMNPQDIKQLGLASGSLVDLFGCHSTKNQNLTRVAKHFMVVPYEIPESCVATYFPEANVLVPIDQYARKSHTPASKSVVIKIESTKTALHINLSSK